MVDCGGPGGEAAGIGRAPENAIIEPRDLCGFGFGTYHARVEGALQVRDVARVRGQSAKRTSARLMPPSSAPSGREAAGIGRAIESGAVELLDEICVLERAGPRLSLRRGEESLGDVAQGRAACTASIQAPKPIGSGARPSSAS